MKKLNHPANVVDVSSRILGLLGRRKVDPTTEAMKALKGVTIQTGEFWPRDYQQPAIDEFREQYQQNPEPVDVPYDVIVVGAAYSLLGQKRPILPVHLQSNERFMRPTESHSMGQWEQIGGRIERANRKPGLTPDEQQRLIDVLERMLK